MDIDELYELRKYCEYLFLDNFIYEIDKCIADIIIYKYPIIYNKIRTNKPFWTIECNRGEYSDQEFGVLEKAFNTADDAFNYIYSMVDIDKIMSEFESNKPREFRTAFGSDDDSLDEYFYIRKDTVKLELEDYYKVVQERYIDAEYALKCVKYNRDRILNNRINILDNDYCHSWRTNSRVQHGIDIVSNDYDHKNVTRKSVKEMLKTNNYLSLKESRLTEDGKKLIKEIFGYNGNYSYPIHFNIVSHNI